MKKKIFFFVLISIILITLIWFYKYNIKYWWPIKKVQVYASMKYVTSQEIEDLLLPKLIDKSFFYLKMNKIKKTLSKNNWAKEINIERVWPDTIRIKFNEEIPLVYWQDQAIITEQTCKFIPISDKLAAEQNELQQNLYNNLPILVGEQEKNKKLCDILESLLFYTKLNNIDIRKVFMSNRGTWQLELLNGDLIYLGKQDILNRLKKFISFYSGFVRKETNYFDLRYHNGIAVGEIVNRSNSISTGRV